MSDDEVFVTARDEDKNIDDNAPSSDDTSPLQSKFGNHLGVDIDGHSAKLRSSLVKEGTRRSPSKKTVSFSSMPAEKKISNGKRKNTVCVVCFFTSINTSVSKMCI